MTQRMTAEERVRAGLAPWRKSVTRFSYSQLLESATQVAEEHAAQETEALYVEVERLRRELQGLREWAYDEKMARIDDEAALAKHLCDDHDWPQDEADAAAPVAVAYARAKSEEVERLRAVVERLRAALRVSHQLTLDLTGGIGRC